MTLSVTLPTLHPGQVAAYIMPGRRKVIRCGRRWGKTELLSTIASDRACKGLRAGIFAPENKFLDETYDAILDTLGPIVPSVGGASRQKGRIRTITGGRIDFWTLDNERAGRGRKYHDVLIDEAAFTKNGQMWDIWTRAIEPTLLDYGGRCWVLSNTNGVDPGNFLYKICNDKSCGFTDYHAPVHENPHIKPEEIERIKLTTHPMAWRQEYLAEFVDWSGDAFFPIEWMLEENQGVDWPDKCDTVFAVIDSAMKDRVEHDGTAVSYFAVNKYYGTPLILLDWDIISINAALLETWVVEVFERLEYFAQVTRAREGSKGILVEDEQSGTVLLQQCEIRGWPATALPSELTAAGKSGRARNVGGHIYQGKLKMSKFAHEKVSTFKGITKNHWASQVSGFRIGMKEGAADDLLDTMTYGAAVALGSGPEGFA